MDWLAHIDLYCERTAPGFWNEPLNAISNLAFILAALWGAATMRRLKLVSWPAAAAIALVFSIGVGSFLFHTIANGLTEQADVVPIWTFVAFYILLAVHHFGGVGFGRIGPIAALVAAIILAALWITSGGVTTDAAVVAAADPLNGTQQYAPAVIGLYVFAFFAYSRGFSERHLIGMAALAFTLSLVARTIDPHLCSILPFGTHFVWHILNATMIALLLEALLRQMAARKTSTVLPVNVPSDISA